MAYENQGGGRSRGPTANPYDPDAQGAGGQQLSIAEMEELVKRRDLEKRLGIGDFAADEEEGPSTGGARSRAVRTGKGGRINNGASVEYLPGMSKNDIRVRNQQKSKADSHRSALEAMRRQARESEADRAAGKERREAARAENRANLEASRAGNQPRKALSVPERIAQLNGDEPGAGPGDMGAAVDEGAQRQFRQQFGTKMTKEQRSQWSKMDPEERQAFMEEFSGPGGDRMQALKDASEADFAKGQGLLDQANRERREGVESALGLAQENIESAERAGQKLLQTAEDQAKSTMEDFNGRIDEVMSQLENRSQVFEAENISGMSADMQRQMGEIDRDPMLTPAQKQQLKSQMREQTDRRRSQLVTSVRNDYEQQRTQLQANFTSQRANLQTQLNGSILQAQMQARSDMANAMQAAMQGQFAKAELMGIPDRFMSEFDTAFNLFTAQEAFS